MISGLLLRPVEARDLEIFFQQQQDPAANHMAAFTHKDPQDRVAFDRHWKRILDDGEVTARTIVFQDQVVGHIAKFVMNGDAEVTYWICQPGEGRCCLIPW